MNHTLVHLPITSRKSIIAAGKLFLVVCSLFLLSSCGDGSDSTSLVSTQTVASDQSTTSSPTGQRKGVAQKGPFAIESRVELSELDITGNPTGKTKQTTVSSNTGAFFYDSVDQWSYINIHVEGSFYDESAEASSTQPISLSAISTDSAHTSVNLLTYWIAERSKHLLEGNASLVEALKQSEQELNQLLGILHANQLDITQASHLTTDNASLLLISGVLMDVARQHQLNASILIEQIAVDFAEHGRLEGPGKDWLIRMQAVIRDNPHAHTSRYARVLNKLSGVTAPSGDTLPSLIALASRPAAIVPTLIFGRTGATVILDGSASNDGQGAEPVSFTWFRVDQQGFDAPISDRFIASPSVTLPNQAAELLFALIVTDADGLIDTSVVKVIVSEVFNNTLPVANSQLISTDEDTPINILLTGSDQDGDPLNFPLATPLLLSNGLLDGTPPNLTYIPTQDFNGTDSFNFTVSDGKESSAPATVNITINPVNDRPVANAGADQSVEVGGAVEPTVILNGSGSDIDGSVALFAWTQTSGITIPLSNTGIANPTLLPPPELPPPDTDSNNDGIPDFVFTYELVVTDNEGAVSVADSVTITVSLAPNLPPVANAGIDQTVTSGDLVTLNGSGTDTDGAIVEFVWADNGIPLSNPNSPAPTFTAPVTTTIQTFTFELIVFDDRGTTSVADTVTITVNPAVAVNNPPVASPGTFTDTGTFDITSLGSDPDGDLITFQLGAVNNTPGANTGITFDFSGFPVVSAIPVDNFEDATGSFEFTVTDDSGLVSSPTTVQVAFTLTNQRPVANAGLDQTVTSGDLVTLNGTGTDLDGTVDVLIWIENGITLSDTNSAAPTFTAPVTTTTQVLTFGLRVVDNGGAVSLMDDTVTITVNPASNIPPVANAGPDQSVEVGGAVEPTIILNGSGSDSDGSVVLFAWTQTGGATIIPLSDTAVANPTLVPPPDLPPLVTALVLIYELVVTDNQGAESVADSVTITVNPFINLPPVANAGVDQTVTPGDVVTLNGSGTDADGTIVAFVWADNGIPLSDPNSAAPTFTAPVTEFTQEFTFDLIVTDNSGAASAIDSVAITVNPAANQLPVALIAGGDQIVAPGETVFLDGNASFDLDGTIIGFEWTIDDPTIILTDSSIQNPSFTAPSIGGSLLVTLIVTDNLGEISVPVSINILVDDLGGGGGIPPGGP